MSTKTPNGTMAHDHPVEVVVIDCGSESCKVGFAGQDEPCDVFRCVVGQRNELYWNVPGLAENPSTQNVVTGEW